MRQGWELGAEQIVRHAGLGPVRTIVDACLGTGASLVELRRHFPDAELIGLDLSAGMLAVARGKLPVRTIHDDVRNIGRHIPAGSVDLLVAHFMTAYVPAATIVAATAPLVRPGGLFSISGGTYDAVPRLQELALRFVTAEFLRQVNPAPEGPGELADAVRAGGLEVVEQGVTRCRLRFADFADLIDWGMRSGCYVHILTALGPERLAEIAEAAGGSFPFEDEYRAAVLLARLP